MKNLVHVFYLLALVNSFMHEDIIKAYFKEKAVRYGVIIGCFNKTEHLQLMSNLLQNEFMANILNMNNITLEKLKVLIKRDHIVGVVIDVDCNCSKTTLELSSELVTFDVKHHWLFLSNTTNINHLFEQANVYINADIHVASFSLDDPQKIMIADFYNPSTEYGGQFFYTTLGYYTREEGYQARIREARFWMRRNLTGINFNTMIVLPEPFEGNLLDYLKNDTKREINTFNRYHSRLVHQCKKYYNFTMTIKRTRSWGYKQPDGTFDGMVGAIQKKQIDFGLSPLYFRVERAKVIEYGRLTWELRTALMFRHPKPTTSVQVFLEPLSTYTWVLTLFAGTIGVFALRICLHQERVTLKQPNIDNSWSILIISIIGAMCQQGLTKTPYLLSGRMITLSLFLLFLLIYQFYSASIVSHLLMKVTITIKTVADILYSNMEVGCQDIVYNRDYFRNTNDTASKELYLKKIYRRNNQSRFLPVEKGLSLVLEGNYAFQVELVTAYPLIEKTFGLKEICELREVLMIQNPPVHTCTRKKSPYRDMVETCLQKLAQNGILDREAKFWHPRKPQCIHSASSRNFNVGVDDLYPAFMALAIGIGLSLVLLLIERHVYKRFYKTDETGGRVMYPFIN